MDAPGWLTAAPIAHRGLHDAAGGIVENTASAVSAAIAAGYAIEVDLQVAADGEAMVFHDETLDRLTDESGLVAARSAEELRQVSMRDTADKIMTLPGLLQLVAGCSALFLEIKSRWDGTAPLAGPVARALQGYDGDVAVMSFDPVQVAALKKSVPGRSCGLVGARFDSERDRARMGPLTRFRLANLLPALALRPQFVAYDVRALPTLATRAARALGLPLLTWTVRSEAERTVARAHADQIIFEGYRP